MKKNVVLGAGISGLSASRVLMNNKQKPLFLDKNSKSGGLTQSFTVDGYTFDYTGHFLHLAKHKTVEDLTNKKNPSWKKYNRNALCYVNEYFTNAPFQYNLSDLPKSMSDLCYEGFINKDTKDNELSVKKDLNTYFKSNFGEPISEIFLKPYNEKLFATDLSNLSVDSISRFFPGPDEKKIIDGLRKKNNKTQVAYNSSFFYPTSGGIQHLVNDLDSGVNLVRFNLDEISIEDKLIKSKDGLVIKYDRLFSSIPLNILLNAVNNLPSELIAAAKKLEFNKVVCVQIGVTGKLDKKIADAHWVYVPDKKIPFFRIGCYSNVAKNMSPDGGHSLYAEVSISSNQKFDINLIQKDVINCLDDLNWINKNNIITSITHVINPGYVHFNHYWKESRTKLINYLEAHSITTLGRYGRWDYVSMEDVILDSRQRTLQVVHNEY
jgi:protoporphyrinogen oxidase